MELVTEKPHLASNLAELERLRNLKSGSEHRDYVSLIKMGTCFVPYDSSEGLAFAPSRFIGYVDNTLQRHAANDRKDGRDTNPAISEILRCNPEPNDEMNAAYQQFCDRLGFEARESGNFGAPRKFWPHSGLVPLGRKDAGHGSD